MARIPVSLPGTPSGKHSDALAKTEQCFCGSCSNKKLGWPKPVIVTLKARA